MHHEIVPLNQAATCRAADYKHGAMDSMAKRDAFRRLAANPDDAEGWARLVRSYMVLGRGDDAKAALAKARTALAGKPDRLAVVEAEARSAGIE